MNIVIDTNILVADYHFHGTSAQVFLDGLHLIPATLCVPEVVIDETVNRFQQDVDKAQKAERALSRLLGERRSPMATPVISARIHAENYRERLVAMIEQAGGKVLPYSRSVAIDWRV